MPLPMGHTPFETASLNECVQKWHRFCGTLQIESRVALVYHGDADGAIGATVVDHLLSIKLNRPPALYWVGTDEYDFGELQAWLDGAKPTHVVFIDVAIENEPDVLAAIIARTQSAAFIFDHHLVRQTGGVDSVILANPTPEPLRPGEVPVPSFAFALALSRGMDLQFPDWLLIYVCFAEGVDSFVEPFLRDLISAVGSIEDGMSLRDWYRHSPLGRLGSLVRAAFSEEAKTHEVVRRIQKNILEKRDSCESLLRDLEKNFGASADRIATAISTVVAKYETDILEVSDRLIAIPINDVHSVAGPVASILRGKAPNKIILTWIRKKEITVCELRTGFRSEINLVALLKKVAQHVPLVNFGGHASAAGALVLNTQFEVFLLTLRKAVAG